MFVMIIAYVHRSFSSSLFLLVLKFFSYNVCLNLCRTKVLKSSFYIFIALLFYQKNILLSSRNYNSKFLYLLEIYLHKLKLISCSFSHSLKNTYLQKSVHIWYLYFTKISENFVLKPTLKFLSEPDLHSINYDLVNLFVN